MPNRLFSVTAPAGYQDTIRATAEECDVLDIRERATLSDGRISIELAVGPDNRQDVLDRLQAALGGSEDWRIDIFSLEATLPAPGGNGTGESRRATGASTREELYNEVAAGASLSWTYLYLVGLSTVVAAIGLLADYTAVVIGAMVIAPLLGPNLALSLGAALGDRMLIVHAIRTLIAGLVLVLVISAALGAVYPPETASVELMSRVDVNMASVVLALASGAAAVLSLTTGLSAGLVGVMVAVALLPPAAATGLFLGAGVFHLAISAALLLAVNIVSVNLAAQLVFMARGIKPRTWLEKQAARQSSLSNLLALAILLALMLGAIYFYVPRLLVTAGP